MIRDKTPIKSFTLLEIIVSGIVILIFSAAIFTVSFFYRHQLLSHYHFLEAIDYARAVMEDLIYQAYDSPDLNPTTSQDVELPCGEFKDRFGGRATKSIIEMPDPSDSSKIMGKRIEIVVTWRDEREREHEQRIVTFYANPY
jgi:hypothetical protein